MGMNPTFKNNLAPNCACFRLEEHLSNTILTLDDVPVPSDREHQAGLWPRPRSPRCGLDFWAGCLALALGLVEVGGAATPSVDVRDALSLRGQRSGSMKEMSWDSQMHIHNTVNLFEKVTNR